VTGRVNTPADVAAVLRAHWDLGGRGVVVAQPIVADSGLGDVEWQEALAQAQYQAREQGVRGKAITPFLLARVAEITGGRTLRANQALIVANARLAAQIAAIV
jgi:pseudouridine-5'-phosphate glycosidase